MRKLMTLAAMLAMVMVAAAPAFAQSSPLIDQSEDNSGDGGGGNQYNAAGVNCTQILQQVGGNQYAGAVGAGEGDTAAANNQTFTAAQYQQCLAIAGNNNAAAQNIGDTNVSGGDNGGDTGGDNGGGTTGGDMTGGGTSGGGASASAGGASATAGGTSGGASASAGGTSAGGATLPDTGGYSLIALGAGALLVAGGLVVRRIVR